MPRRALRSFSRMRMTRRAWFRSASSGSPETPSLRGLPLFLCGFAIGEAPLVATCCRTYRSGWDVLEAEWNGCSSPTVSSRTSGRSPVARRGHRASEAAGALGSRDCAHAGINVMGGLPAPSEPCTATATGPAAVRSLRGETGAGQAPLVAMGKRRGGADSGDDARPCSR